MSAGKVLALLFVIFIFSNFTYSQKKYSPEQERVRDYLQKYFERKHKDVANLHEEFADFLPLDETLEKDLKKSFPMYHFFIVRTFFSHWVSRDNETKILVVTNAETGEPIAYRWALWYAGYSGSFSHILEPVQFEDKNDAKAKIKLFSELIVSLERGGGKISDLKIEGGSISVDLDNNWRIMKVGFSRHHFKEITFINPKINKKDKPEKEKN
jgi:hypothetical protein